MRYRMNVIMLIMYLYVLFTLLITTHNKGSHQFTIKPRTSTETGVLSVNSDIAKTSGETSVGTSDETSIGTFFGTSIGASIAASVGTSIGASIAASVGTSIGAAIGASVGTSVGTSAGDKHCSRKDHVVYIKTHKTGSTTVSHIFWR